MTFSGPKSPTHPGVPVETPYHPTSPDIQLGLSQEARAPTRPQKHVPFLTTIIPDTAGGQGAEAAGGLLRVRHPRVELEAGGQAALAGGGLGLNHPQLRAKDGRRSPVRRGLRQGREIQVRGSRGGMPPIAPLLALGPHPAARAPAPAPCAGGPGSHLLVAAAAPARPGELPSQTEASGQAASGETLWRSGSLAAGQERSSHGGAIGDDPQATTPTGA